MQTIHLEWTHPHKGRIIEEVCDEHHTEVHAALRTLGIGCSGSVGRLGICWRCIYKGYLFREWMDQIDMEPYFGSED